MTRRKKKGPTPKRKAGHPVEWILLPRPAEPEPVFEPEDPRMYTEEETKLACELCLLFMLIFFKRRHGEWYRYCVEQSLSYPGGSYRNVFWWGMRMGGGEGGFDLDDFRVYLAWKIEQYDKGFIRRDKGRW